MMNKRSLIFLAVAALTAPVAAYAAWPSNATSAVVVTDAPGQQVQPKIVPLADGGYYVAWFDGGNGFDVRLQRYDRNGNALWANGGILVADRDVPYTTNYGLDSDAAGNAVLAYRFKDGTGKLQAAVTKIGADGTQLWSRIASADAGDVLTANVAVTADGGTVVAWQNFNGQETLQKLDASGQLAWGTGVQIVAPSGAFAYPADVQGSGDDVIVSFVVQGRSTGNQLWAQKYDAAGQPLWSSSYVKVWEDTATGNLGLGYFPEFVSDGAGGAVFCWQYNFNASDSNIRVQHVLADGTDLYPHNGVALSTDAHDRKNVVCSYDGKTGDVYALWREMGDVQDDSGVYAQHVDTGGSRLWGDSGQALVPVGTNSSYSSLLALPRKNGFIAQWTTDSLTLESEPVQAAAIDSTGQAAWRRPIVQYKRFDGEVARVVGAPTRVGGAVFVWENNQPGSSGETDLMMQKVGAFGGVGSPGN
jgi:hypothetical protein